MFKENDESMLFGMKANWEGVVDRHLLRNGCGPG